MIRAHFNQKAHIWDETVSEKDPAKLERMSRRLDIKPGSLVLDVGTGTGVFIPYLLSKIGNDGRIVALDFAEEMLKIAQAKSFDSDIDYLCADVHDIPRGDEVFDSVVCYSSFPHFHDKPRALAEINRVTKKSGKLFVCHTSSREKINQIHRGIPTVQNDIIPDAGEMEMLLSMAGFVDIMIDDGDESYLADARKP